MNSQPWKGICQMKRKYPFVFIIMFSVLLAHVAINAQITTVPRLSKDQLREMLGDPNVVIIDVRIEGDWKKSDKKIKGAVREDSKKIQERVGKFDKDKTYVLYCA